MHVLAKQASAGALVVKEKFINENGPIYVRIVGRKSGLVSWFLTLIGIDTTTVLQITEDVVQFQNGSLSGNIKEVIPVASISNLGTGYLKPVLYLIYGIVCLIAAPVTFGITLIPCIIFLWKYFMGKTMVVYLIPTSGNPCMISLKRSLIEMQTLTNQEADRVVNILTRLVEKSHHCH